MDIREYIPQYEAQTGRQIPAEVVAIIGRIDSIGQKFQAKGRKDAAQGLPVPSEDAFREWSGKFVQDKIEFLEELAGVLRLCYMDGYNAIAEEMPA